MCVYLWKQLRIHLHYCVYIINNTREGAELKYSVPRSNADEEIIIILSPPATTIISVQHLNVVMVYNISLGIFLFFFLGWYMVIFLFFSISIYSFIILMLRCFLTSQSETLHAGDVLHVVVEK